MTEVASRDPFRNLAGVRLSTGPKPRAHRAECFRCSDVDRVLHGYGIVRAGTLLGTIQLCGTCLADLTPLDPDPLSVPQAS